MTSINNKITKTEIGSKLLLLLILTNLLSFLDINIFNIYNSIAFYGNFIMIILILVLQNKFQRKEQELIIFLIFFIMYAFITLFITEGTIGSIITPVYSILIFWIISRVHFTHKFLKLLFITMLVVNLFWVINSSGYYMNSLYNQGDYINSNTIGMLLMYSALYMSIFIKRLNSNFLYIWKLLIYITSGWGIINVQSRGALLGLVSFIILDSFVPKTFWKSRGRVIFVAISIIIVGILFPYIYTKMYINGFKLTMPYISKDLYTGREVIWNNFYNMIKDSEISLLVGLGSNADLWVGHSLNLHNNYLGVIANFGIIGFILYYGFFLKQVSNVYKNKNVSSYQVSLVVGFLCVLFMGAYEISTLWFSMFFFNFMFLGLALNDNNNDNFKDEEGKGV